MPGAPGAVLWARPWAALALEVCSQSPGVLQSVSDQSSSQASGARRLGIVGTIYL